MHSFEHGETFHPVVGPMAEARGLHVGESRLAERVAGGGGAFVIWDVGLGAAANAIAVLEALSAAETAREIELHSFDSTTAPLEFAVAHAAELGYLADWMTAVRALLGEGTAQAGRVRWSFHRGDFTDLVREPAVRAVDAILYDPYSPLVNPGMWTLEHFTRLRARLDPGRLCTLTSYSRSTSVRVALALAGFFVGLGRATGEKDQTTVAATRREYLKEPLGADWLDRVRRSSRGAPLREAGTPGPISAEDLALLVAAVAGGCVPEPTASGQRR